MYDLAIALITSGDSELTEMGLDILCAYYPEVYLSLLLSVL